MYAAREGKGCSHCHVRPAGGQELNTAGQFYKSHAFSFKGFTAGRAPAAAKLVIAPGKKPAAAKALGKAKKQAAAPKPRNRR